MAMRKSCVCHVVWMAVNLCIIQFQTIENMLDTGILSIGCMSA